MISNRELFLKYLGQTSESPYLLEIEKAKGIYLYGPKNQKYIDLIAGVSVSNLGHGDDRIKNAVLHQIEKYSHLMVYGEYIQSPQTNLAKELCTVLPKSLDNVFFVNSGSEAIDAALKLAKKYTGRPKVVAFNNAYHGGTHGALSVTGNEDLKRAFRPLLPEVYHIDYNSVEQLDIIDSKTACVVIESVQAESGIHVADINFIYELVKHCKKNSVLIIADEVQTGFGRTGKMFGFEHLNFTPDIVCIAKALGAGMPLGAFIAPKYIMNTLTKNPALGHITTFGGHPVSAAAALCGLKIIKEDKLIETVSKKGDLFKKNIHSNKIKDIRGIGLFRAVELDSFTMILKFIRKAINNGLITDWFLFDNKSFRIAPPLTISEQQILEACEIINKSLKQI
jgi:putrescine aminotransferase